MKNKQYIVFLIACIITILSGLLIIIGWFTHSDFLRTLVQGQLKAKFNVALGFVFSSIALLLLYYPGKSNSRKKAPVVLAVLVSLLGLLTLLEYISGINFGIDEFFVKDELPATTGYYAGRMSPLSALNFLLIGFSLFLFNREKTAVYQFSWLSGIAFISLIMLIGFNFTPDIPTFVHLTIHVAIGFITLPIAVWFGQPALHKKISFERKLITGFTAVILVIAMTSVLSFYYNNKRINTTRWVIHTNDVLSEAERILSFTKDVEAAGRGFVLTGDSSYLDPFTAAKENIYLHINHLEELTRGNTSQQTALDSLPLLIDKRIDFSQQTINLRNEQGLDAANKLINTGRGKFYSEKIREQIAKIEEVEKTLHSERLKENNNSNLSFNRAFIIFLALVFILLVIILLSVRNNIGARKKAEAEISDREEQIQTIFKAAPDPVIVIDESGNIVKWNPRAETLFGWKEKDVVGKLLSKIIIPDRFREAHTKGMKHFLRTGEGPLLGKVIETRALTKSNTEIDVALNIAAAPKVKDRYLFIGFVRDITEQKKAEEKTKENEYLFSTLFYKSPIMKCITEAQTGKFVEVNDAFADFAGYRKEEILGKTSFELNMLVRPEKREQVIEKIKETGRVRNEEAQVTDKNGRIRWLSTNIDVMNLNGKDCFLTAAIDITTRKEAEEKIRQMNTDLEQRVSERTTELYKSEKKYRYLFENNPMPMWIIDLSSFKFLDVNEDATAHYGYSRKEFLSMTAFDIRPEDEKKRFKHAPHPEKISQNEYHRGIWKHLKKDGTIIYVELIAHDIIYEGKMARFILSNDITERIMTEEKLKKSVKEITDYKYALDESSIVAITDQKGIIKHANENFCRISKYSAEELIGQDHRIINSGYHPKEFIRDLWVTIANGKIWRGELKNKAKDGSIYWVDTTIVPFLNEDGKPYQYVAIRADITERKQAEQAFNESQQLLLAIIDNSTAVIYVKNLEGQYLLVNRRFSEVFHLSPDAILGKTDYDLFTKEVADAFRKMDVRTAAANHALTEEEKVPEDDGLHTYISVKSTLRDETGRPYAIFGISTDITELKAVEENLRKSFREISDYKFALDESSIVAITDQKGIIKYVNNNFCKISKYSREELIGQDHRIINSSYHSKEFIRDLWVTIANGNIWRGELKNKAKDGSIYWVDTTIIPFLNEEEKPYQYVAIRADITEKKKAESEIQKLNEELEQKVIARTAELNTVNSEMEAFTYSVSHDLRAPLRGIIGFTAILEEDYVSQLDDEAKRITGVIRRNTMKMGHLIDDLLAFSRTGKQELMKTQIHTQSMVKEIIDDLMYQNKEHTPINWNVHSLPSVRADMNTIRQVWINLISNAIKYSGTKEQAVIEIGSGEENGQTFFYIKDNGVGFDEKYKHKLFKVFQRLHSADEFEGTGVGLALVEKIVSRHGGRVWAEGKPEEGACFYFSLP
jgi:PAS domain S-box-containing protein